jgi:hypothetical protein
LNVFQTLAIASINPGGIWIIVMDREGDATAEFRKERPLIPALRDTLEMA